MRKMLTVFVGVSTLSLVDYTNESKALAITEPQQEPISQSIDTVFTVEKPITINPLLQIDYEDSLMNAMIFVESQNKDSVIGDNGKAIGILQMHKIAVRSVNKILKKNDIDLEYSYDDRYSRQKTIEMYWIWRNAKHNSSNYETIARSWNGGPRGPKKTATIHYWNKVEKEMKNHHQNVMLVDGTLSH